ncbi:GNAT family N-acetyltransferase [Nocardioidaceae bacterium]|nr:GNAT family N-acetyltransferase [Nocardioidaceae bacterium]
MAPDPGPPPPRLRGERVVLRALTEQDLPRLVQAVTDTDSTWATTVPTPYGAREAEQYLAYVRRGWAENTHWVFCLEDTATPGTYAGGIDLHSTGAGRAAIGFLTHPDARGRGLTTDAVRTILRWGLGPMRLTSVEWRARVGNAASAHVARAVGFAYEGRIREGFEQRGVRHDCWAATVLAGEPLRDGDGWPDEVLDPAGVPVR